MLPSRFPDEGQAPERSEYNTVDATLWYIEAIRAHYAVAGSQAVVQDLFSVPKEIVDWRVRDAAAFPGMERGGGVAGVE